MLLCPHRANCRRAESSKTAPHASQTQIPSPTRHQAVNVAIGAACLLGFFVLRCFIVQYQLRTVLSYITIPPPPVPSGVRRLFSWVKPVFTVSDTWMLHSAGLDALVMQKSLALCIQLFLPIAALGCCLRERRGGGGWVGTPFAAPAESVRCKCIALLGTNTLSAAPPSPRSDAVAAEVGKGLICIAPQGFSLAFVMQILPPTAAPTNARVLKGACRQPHCSQPLRP